MESDIPPTDEEILTLIKTNENLRDPRQLIKSLALEHEMKNVISALQRAIERGTITLDSEGMVVAIEKVACAA